MPAQRSPSPATLRIMRVILLTGLAGVTLVLKINAYDSGVLKTPLLVATALLLAAVLPAAVLLRVPPAVQHTRAGLPVLALATLALAGLAIAPVAPLARQAVLLTLSCTACFFAATQCLTGRAPFRSFLTAIGWLAAVVALFAAIEVFLGDWLGLEFFLGAERRAGSTIGNPAYLGGWIVLVVPLLLAAALDTDSPAALRRLNGVLAAVLGVLLLATRSRSGMAGCAVSLGLFFLLRARPSTRRRVLVGVLAAAAVTAVLLPVIPPLAARVISAVDPSWESTLARRWFFWDAGVRAFLASPVWGHGAGSFEPAMIGYRSPGYWIARSEDVVPHAHNAVVETAAELGTIGLVLAGWLCWMLLRSARAALRSPAPWRRLAGAALAAGLAGLLTDNAANVSLQQAPVAALAWTCAGILAVLGTSDDGSGRQTLRMPRALAGLLAASCAGALVWLVSSIGDALVADRFTITGLLRAGKGETALAVEDLRTAVNRNPASYVARSSLAGELLRLNRPSDALGEAERLLAEYPDYPRAWMVKAVGLLAAGRTSEALTAIDRDLSLRDHPEGFYVRAAILRAASDTAGERNALAMLLERCTAGRIPMHAAYAASRLRELAGNRTHLLELERLLEAAAMALPEEKTVQANLVLVRKALAAPP